jgi:hypothetical protein
MVTGTVHATYTEKSALETFFISIFGQGNATITDEKI